MMKRILSLALLLVTVSLLLVGCGKTDLEKSKDYIENNKLVNNNPKLTLSFCLVTEQKLDVAALSTMENLLNEKLEISYNTHLDFINLTSAEYESYLYSKLQAVEDAREDDDGEGSDTLLGNEFPEVKDTQFDILLVTSFEMLTDLIDDGRLYELTNFMASTKYRNLKNYVTASFLEAAKLGEDERTFAIPNCTLLGEYTYMVVNKAAAAKFGYFLASDLTNWESTESLRAQIQAAGDYTFSADPYDVNAPVRLVKGNYEMRDSFGADNYWYVESDPTANRSEIFNSMLAISAYTVNADRAMQIVYALNSDPELRTMLRYGVKNTTYELKDGVVTIKTGADYTYDANDYYTGNIFALYPCSDRGQTAALMAGWKVQNDALTFVDNLPSYTPPAPVEPSTPPATTTAPTTTPPAAE